MSDRKMHPDFDSPPKSTEEVGFRLDYLRSEGKLKGVRGPATIGEAAELVGSSTDQVAKSKRFYDHDRK
jgi:hypothetical protein